MTPIIVETDGHILKIGINRPEKKNALTLDMYDQMSAALEDAEADPSIRCVIIHGLGGNFCSGNDLSGFPKDPAKGGPTPVMRFVKAFVHASVPIVAAVEGVAAVLHAGENVVDRRDAEHEATDTQDERIPARPAHAPPP